MRWNFFWNLYVWLFYLQYIDECYVFGNIGIIDDQFDIFGTVYTHLMPEQQQSL